MNVLHVTSSLDPIISGGPARALAGLVLEQQKVGINCSIFSTWLGEFDHSLFRELRKADIPISLVGPCVFPLKRHPDLKVALNAAIKKADVVHIHALWEEVHHHAARLSRGMGIPYIFRPCGMLAPWSLSQRRLKKMLYLRWRLLEEMNGAAAIHYTTEGERVNALPVGLKSRAIIARNGIDLEEFRSLPPRGLFRRLFPSLNGRKFILTLSRIHPKKGFDLLIPAFAQANLPDTFLVIAGADDIGYTPTIMKLIAQHNVGERIIFAGSLNSKQRIEALVDADLFILPSYQENFGVAVVEAAAAGLPAIVSECVNLRNEVVRAGAGDVVPLNPDAIAATLREWIRDDDRRKTASNAARAFAFEEFDWVPVAGQWKNEYENIVAKRPRR